MLSLICLVELLVGCFGGSVMMVDISGKVNKKANLRFWIESYAWGVSLCFRSLDIAYILCNYIQDIPGSLCLSLLFFNLDRLSGDVI